MENFGKNNDMHNNDEILSPENEDRSKEEILENQIYLEYKEKFIKKYIGEIENNQEMNSVRIDAFLKLIHGFEYNENQNKEENLETVFIKNLYVNIGEELPYISENQITSFIVEELGLIEGKGMVEITDRYIQINELLENGIKLENESELDNSRKKLLSLIKINSDLEEKYKTPEGIKSATKYRLELLMNDIK